MRRSNPNRNVARLAGLAAALVLAGAAVAVPASAQSLTPPAAPPVSTTEPSATVATLPPWSAQVVDSSEVSKALSRAATPVGAPPIVAPPTTVKPKAKRAKATLSPTSSTTALPSILPAILPAIASGSNVAGSLTVAADDAAVWAALRKCESGGRYDLNTGNGYYGAYQFALGTWQRLGYPGYPHQATAAIQDEAAKRLQATQGWGPWPECARRISAR